MDLTRSTPSSSSPRAASTLGACNQLAAPARARAPRPRRPVAAFFRAVHTIKGMAATMGYTAVAELAHELETVLDRVRRGAISARRRDLMNCSSAPPTCSSRRSSAAVAGREREGDVSALVARSATVRWRARGRAVRRSPRARHASVASPSGDRRGARRGPRWCGDRCGANPPGGRARWSSARRRWARSASGRPRRAAHVERGGFRRAVHVPARRATLAEIERVCSRWSRGRTSARGGW